MLSRIAQFYSSSMHLQLLTSYHCITSWMASRVTVWVRDWARHMWLLRAAPSLASMVVLSICWKFSPSSFSVDFSCTTFFLFFVTYDKKHGSALDKAYSFSPAGASRCTRQISSPAAKPFSKSTCLLSRPYTDLLHLSNLLNGVGMTMLRSVRQSVRLSVPYPQPNNGAL